MGRSRRELIPGPALVSALRAGVPPVCALVGPENFLKEDALRLVREALGDDAEVEAFDGPRNDAEASSFDPAAVFDGLRTGFLFGGSRVVVLRRADRFVKDHGDGLARALEKPASGAVLVLFLKKLDGRRKIAKVVRLHGLEVSCRSLYDRPPPWQKGRDVAHDHELSRWTVERARRHGKRISLEVAHGLTEHTGNEPGRIDGALETLALYVGARPEIGAEDVGQLVADSGEQTVWRLCDEILDRDGPRALRTMAATFRNGLAMGDKAVRDPMGIGMVLLGSLVPRVRDLYRARRAGESGTPRLEVIETFGPRSSAFRPRFERQLGRWDAATLARALSELAGIELALKSGGAPAGPEIVFETFAADLCRRPPRRTASPVRAGRE